VSENAVNPAKEEQKIEMQSTCFNGKRAAFINAFHVA
jgi:hypothetical protein